jgi:hypothetical protein
MHSNNNAIANVQALSGALSYTFCGEELLKYTRLNVLWDAWTVITNTDNGYFFHFSSIWIMMFLFFSVTRLTPVHFASCLLVLICGFFYLPISIVYIILAIACIQDLFENVFI